ncbi:putative glycolipid-binding domain-containing protein [Nocardia sp. NPDC003345]
MRFDDLPLQAGWRHQGAREGFEVLFTTRTSSGYTLAGQTTAVESGAGWTVAYLVAVDDRWRTTTVRASNRTAQGEAHVELERRNGHRWFVSGVHRPELDGCVDIDFESSGVTNTLPVHRLDLAVGDTVAVPAAFVRAGDLGVERIEQTYTRLDDSGRFGYTSSTFDFACELIFDASGLIVEYPGIAVRVA